MKCIRESDAGVKLRLLLLTLTWTAAVSMVDGRPEEATYCPKLIRKTRPAFQVTMKGATVSKSDASESFPRRPNAGLNVEVRPEQSAPPGPEHIQQVGDKAILNVRSATLWGKRVDGRPADGRRSFWDTVRKSGTAIAAQTVNFSSTPSFVVLSGPELL